MNKDKIKDKIKRKKQFDLSDKQVAPVLQGATLASFGNRMIAFGIDWLLIAAASQFFQFWFFLAAIYLLWKKKMKRTFIQGNIMLSKGAKMMDKTLENYEIEENLRKQFSRYMKSYIYIMMVVVFVSSIIFALAFFIGIIFPDDFISSIGWVEEFGVVFTPVEGLEKVFKFFIGAFGGFAYFSFFTWKWNGQSPGKRIIGIRTVKLNGKPMTLWNSLERVTGYVASASLLLSGFLQYFWDPNHQTTHDKITETIVIRDDMDLSALEAKLQEDKEEDFDLELDDDIDDENIQFRYADD